MKIDTNQIITMTEANQNFSKAVKITDNYGKAVIFKNNKPKYVLLDINDNKYLDLTEDEIITGIALNISSGKYKYEDVLKIIESLKDI